MTVAKRRRIAQRSDTDLRPLLIQATKSAMNTAHQRKNRRSRRVQQLKAGVGWQEGVVALANQHARIL